MVKIKCDYTKKECEIDLSYYLTKQKCPLCKQIIEFSYGYIGLSFDLGVECEDFMHEIIYPNKEGGQR